MSQALTGIVMETYLQQEIMKVMQGSGQQLEIKPLVLRWTGKLSSEMQQPVTVSCS